MSLSLHRAKLSYKKFVAIVELNKAEVVAKLVMTVPLSLSLFLSFSLSIQSVQSVLRPVKQTASVAQTSVSQTTYRVPVYTHTSLAPIII